MDTGKSKDRTRDIVAASLGQEAQLEEVVGRGRGLLCGQQLQLALLKPVEGVDGMVRPAQPVRSRCCYDACRSVEVQVYKAVATKLRPVREATREKVTILIL